MGKRIESFDQSKENITVRFTDDTTYQGDILVGADGAYSAVRRHMYQALKEKSTLPTTDEQPLPFDCVCLVGQTTELDPEEFPEVNVVDVPFNSVLGGERSRCTVCGRMCSLWHWRTFLRYSHSCFFFYL